MAWLSVYENYSSKNLDFFNSDHRPILIDMKPVSHNIDTNCPKSFSFNHDWIMEDKYKKTLKTT